MKIAFIMLLGLLQLTARSQIVYVNLGASGANNGRTWNDAYTDLTRALMRHDNVDVYIAEGLYRPYLDDSGQPATRAATFPIKCGIRLKGGFRILNGNVFWDPDTYRTIFSGDLLNNDVGNVDAPDFNDPGRGENAWQLLTILLNCPGSGSRAFEGIEFVSANNDQPAGTAIAAASLGLGETFSFRRCKFYLNASPSLIRLNTTGNIRRADFSMTNCSAAQNNVLRLAELNDVSFSIIDSRFEKSFQEAGFQLTSNNTATASTDCRLLNSVFINTGNSVVKLDVGRTTSQVVKVLAANSKFINPKNIVSFQRQGECYNPSMPGGLCTGNFPLDSVSFQNCLISGRKEFTLCEAGLISNAFLHVALRHSTVNSRAAGVLFVSRLTNPYYGQYISSPGIRHQITHSIIWGQQGSLFTQSSQGIIWNFSPTVDYSNISSGWNGGTGNMNADPLFVNPAGADNLAGTEDDDLHLQNRFRLWQPISPCIDAGDTGFVNNYYYPTDLDGNPRISPGRPVDMGCYERARNVFISPWPIPLPNKTAPGINTGITISPNPASSFLIVRGLKNDETYSASIRDATGRVVMQQNVTASTSPLQVSHLPKGWYVLTLTGKTPLHYRFIKE
jgi:hypothetical protein